MLESGIKFLIAFDVWVCVCVPGLIVIGPIKLSLWQKGRFEALYLKRFFALKTSKNNYFLVRNQTLFAVGFFVKKSS